jgi:hypothetical protein
MSAFSRVKVRHPRTNRRRLAHHLAPAGMAQVVTELSEYDDAPLDNR